MTPEEHLELGMQHLHEFYKLTGVNSLDNYGYREYGANAQLKSYLPSIFKVPGRSGDDARALDEGYEHIEQKSGTIKAKQLTITNFPKGQFDKQSDPARREYILTYDGLSLSCFEPFQPYPLALIFVTKEHMPKLHPILRSKQDKKLKIFESKTAAGKNIGRDTIDISLEDILRVVDRQDIICYYKGLQVDSIEFFRNLEHGINLDG